MRDDKIDTEAVAATLAEAIEEAASTPKVVGIFDRRKVEADNLTDPKIFEVLKNVTQHVKEAGPNRVVGVGTFVLHEDGVLLRAFHVTTGFWPASLGAAANLQWAMHHKYNNTD